VLTEQKGREEGPQSRKKREENASRSALKEGGRKTRKGRKRVTGQICSIQQGGGGEERALYPPKRTKKGGYRPAPGKKCWFWGGKPALGGRAKHEGPGRYRAGKRPQKAVGGRGGKDQSKEGGGGLGGGRDKTSTFGRGGKSKKSNTLLGGKKRDEISNMKGRKREEKKHLPNPNPWFPPTSSRKKKQRGEKKGEDHLHPERGGRKEVVS